MLENQFIQFFPDLATAKKQPIFPVQLDAANYNKRIEIFNNENDSEYIVEAIEIVNEQGGMIDGEQVVGEEHSVLFVQGKEIANADQEISMGQRFHIKIVVGTIEQGQGQPYARYSQPLIRVPDDFTFISIKYRCDEDAFGFPFGSNTGKYAVISLPIRMHSPQNTQDDKTYEKRDGTIVTLYAKYYKEWECVTEFLSEAMHDKIVAALACDEVYFDGKRVTKSDKYSVDWENYDLDCDGETKLAKATFKVRENITHRNSNF